MRHILAIIVFAAALVPFRASACTCGPQYTVQQAKAKSTRVFLGRVTAIGERVPPTRGVPYKRISFAVIETFKGSPVQDLQLDTGMGGPDCGYFFELGEQYVVYTYGDGDDLAANICSRTSPASNPKSGLEILRNDS